MPNKTTFNDKCSILADLWLNYRQEENFFDFVEYNDLGLPLAFLFSEGIVKAESGQANEMVEETFDLLLSALELEDEGFDTLDDMLARGME
jgi:hypothetical protein